jgi:hypothetical protein
MSGRGTLNPSHSASRRRRSSRPSGPTSRRSVDRYDERAEPAKLVEHTESYGLARRVGRRGPQQRGLERRALRPRQAGHLDSVEEVDQPGERVTRLGAARPRHGHAQPEPACGVDPRLPQRCLSDPRPAGEHERPGPGAVDELADLRQLELAAHQGHGRSLAERRMKKGRPFGRPFLSSLR